MAATWWRCRESMANDDVLSVLQTYGTDSGSSNETRASKRPIYGPQASEPPEPPPEESQSTSRNSTSGEYPNIYGPDVYMIPGTKPGGKDEDSYFTINTDLAKAFPTDCAPQPFLTSFSKFQN